MTIKQIIVAVSIGATALGFVVNRIAKSDPRAKLTKTAQMAASPAPEAEESIFQETPDSHKPHTRDLTAERLFG